MDKLFVNRQGKSKDSYMITTELINIFRKNQILIFNDNYLCKDIFYSLNKIPKSICINGKYIKGNRANQNNILGNNDIFRISNDEIIIPIDESSPYKLQHYGAKIINNNETFELKNNKTMGLYNMKIGKDYVKDYLLCDNLGDGFYIETHDLPHCYYCIDNVPKGVLILGKKINDNIYLTAFKIPKGQGIYISPFVYHCDAMLIGNYNVIYGKTDDYCTMLLKTNENKIVNVKTQQISF